MKNKKEIDFEKAIGDDFSIARERTTSRGVEIGIVPDNDHGRISGLFHRLDTAGLRMADGTKYPTFRGPEKEVVTKNENGQVTDVHFERTEVVLYPSESAIFEITDSKK